MTVREIQGHLAELYGTEVSPDLISRMPSWTKCGSCRTGRSTRWCVFGCAAGQNPQRGPSLTVSEVLDVCSEPRPARAMWEIG
jgi:hypothetical protein